MHQTSISKKGQVVIPLKIRQALNIAPATKLEVTTVNNKVVMTPLPNIDDVYGMFEPKQKITKEEIKKAKKVHLKNKFSKKS